MYNFHTLIHLRLVLVYVKLNERMWNSVEILHVMIVFLVAFPSYELSFLFA